MSKMSDENQNTPAEESTNVKRMRERLEALEERNQTLEARVKLSAFKEAGLDPERGIGKAVYRTYEGEVDPEQIRAFASTEYDWQPEARVPEAQQRMDALGATGYDGERQDSRLEKAQAAAREGNWVESARIKDAELFNIARSINRR